MWRQRALPPWVHLVAALILGWAALSAIVQRDALAAVRVVLAFGFIGLLASPPLVIIALEWWLRGRDRRQ